MRPRGRASGASVDEGEHLRSPYQNGIHLAHERAIVGPLQSVAFVDAARLTSLATGRGEPPALAEWLWLAPLVVLFSLVGYKALRTFGLTRVESGLVAGASPLLVYVDAPLWNVAPRVALAANVTGCIIPLLVGLSVMAQRRLPLAEGLVLLSIGIAVSYASSEVVPDRGVLLQYRVPALVIGIVAAGLLYNHPMRSGAAAFAAGAIGVIVGADLFHLPELAAGGAGRIILGGAALLDGILLVAVLAAAVGEGTALVLRALLSRPQPTRPTA